MGHRHLKGRSSSQGQLTTWQRRQVEKSGARKFCADLEQETTIANMVASKGKNRAVDRLLALARLVEALHPSQILHEDAAARVDDAVAAELSDCLVTERKAEESVGREEDTSPAIQFSAAARPLNDDNPAVVLLLQELLACLCHGISGSSTGRKATRLWSFIEEVDRTQQRRGKAWSQKQEQEDAQRKASDWYAQMFHSELRDIEVAVSGEEANDVADKNATSHYIKDKTLNGGGHDSDAKAQSVRGAETCPSFTCNTEIDIDAILKDSLRAIEKGFNIEDWSADEDDEVTEDIELTFLDGGCVVNTNGRASAETENSKAGGTEILKAHGPRTHGSDAQDSANDGTSGQRATLLTEEMSHGSFSDLFAVTYMDDYASNSSMTSLNAIVGRSEKSQSCGKGNRPMHQAHSSQYGYTEEAALETQKEAIIASCCGLPVKGLHSAILLANSLPLRSSDSESKVFALLRHSLNTHSLSFLIAALMWEKDSRIFKSTFSTKSLLGSRRYADRLLELTIGLDLLSFGFTLQKLPNISSANGFSLPMRTQSSIAGHGERLREGCHFRRSSSAALPSTGSEKLLDGSQSPPSRKRGLPHPSLRSSSSVASGMLEMSPARQSWTRRTHSQVLVPRPFHECPPAPTSLSIFRTPLHLLVTSPSLSLLAALDAFISIPDFVEGSLRLIDASAARQDLFCTELAHKTWEKLLSDVLRVGRMSVWSDVHHATVMLVQFFAELPNTVLPCASYEAFIAANEIELVEERVKNLAHLVNNLPWSNRPILERLISSLARLLSSPFVEQNRLTVATLGRVFGRVLLAPPEEQGGGGRGAPSKSITTVNMMSANKKGKHSWKGKSNDGQFAMSSEKSEQELIQNIHRNIEASLGSDPSKFFSSFASSDGLAALPSSSARIFDDGGGRPRRNRQYLNDTRSFAVVESLLTYNREIFADLRNDLDKRRQALARKIQKLNQLPIRLETALNLSNPEHEEAIRALWSRLLDEGEDPASSPTTYSCLADGDRRRRDQGSLDDEVAEGNQDSLTQSLDHEDTKFGNDNDRGQLPSQRSDKKSVLPENREAGHNMTGQSEVHCSDSSSAEFEGKDISKGCVIEGVGEVTPQRNFKLNLRVSTDRDVDLSTNREGSGANLSIQQILSSSKWAFNGFRQENVIADFQGGGLLSLDCLCYWLDHHPQIARQIFLRRSQRTRSDYPLPLASIHIVRMLLNLLQFPAARASFDFEEKVDIWPEKWLQSLPSKSLSACSKEGTTFEGSGEDETDEPADSDRGVITLGVAAYFSKTKLWRLMDDHYFFEKLFCLSFMMLDRIWSKSGASMMDFSAILADTENTLKRLFTRETPTVDLMWQRWMHDSAQQKELCQEGRVMSTLGPVPHIKQYVVVWPGGVNVRSLPTLDGLRVGTREMGDLIETVEQDGVWVRMREVPGQRDSGWVATRGPQGVLLEEVGDDAQE